MRDFFQVRGWRRFFLAFSIITLSAILLTNCNSGLEPVGQIAGPGIRVESDPVNYLVEDPILQPRYSCAGKPLKYPKYLGVISREVVVPGKIKQVPDSILNQAGYFFGKSNASEKSSHAETSKITPENSKVNSGMDKMFRGSLDFTLGVIFPILLAVLFLLLLWALYHLLTWLWNNRPSFSRDVRPVPTPNSEQRIVGLADLSEDDRKNLVAEIKTGVMNELDSDDEFTARIDRVFYKHVEEETRILQQTGGRVDCVIGRDMYTIEIPPQGKKEEVKPENEQKS